MRKFLLFHIISSQSWGGLEIYVSELLVKLHRHGYSLVVFVLPNAQIARNLEATGIRVFYLKTGKLAFMKNLYLVYLYLKKLKPDIVHTHTAKDAKLACSIGFFYTKTKHIFSTYMGASYKKDWIHTLLYKNIHALVSASANTNRELARMYPISGHKIHLIRYGRAINSYQRNINAREAIRATFEAHAETWVLTTMARYDAAKGIREIVESFLLLDSGLRKNIQIWLIGERNIIETRPNGDKIYEKASEELYQFVKTFIANNKLESHIRMIPFQKNYIEYLDASDAFILGSWYEMYSLSVIDAMCMGLPVLGALAGGTTEQIGNNERGLGFTPRSAASIAESITRLYADKPLQKHFGQTSKIWALENHRWENVLEEFDKLYHKVLENP